MNSGDNALNLERPLPRAPIPSDVENPHHVVQPSPLYPRSYNWTRKSRCSRRIFEYHGHSEQALNYVKYLWREKWKKEGGFTIEFAEIWDDGYSPLSDILPDYYVV
jgi:hypothetical protein